MEADVDLSDATFEVYLEGAWRPCQWVAAAVQTTDIDGTSIWTRTAQIQVAGTVGNPGLPINSSHRYPEYRVTVGGETIVRHSKYSLMLRS